MKTEKHEVVAGIKSKEITKIFLNVNGHFEPGTIIILGNIKTLELLGYDESGMFTTEKQKKESLIEKMGLKK